MSMRVTTHLDVRPVEPKERFERIMGAYEGLAAGETLELVVDHEPRCMYYTLLATRGEAAFEFDYVERGPPAWTVRVLRRKVEAPAPADEPSSPKPEEEEGR